MIADLWITICGLILPMLMDGSKGTRERYTPVYKKIKGVKKHLLNNSNKQIVSMEETCSLSINICGFIHVTSQTVSFLHTSVVVDDS